MARAKLRPCAVLTIAAAITSIAAQTPSGLDLSTFDRAVRPQDDLYRFANGAWLDATEVPPSACR